MDNSVPRSVCLLHSKRRFGIGFQGDWCALDSTIVHAFRYCQDVDKDVYDGPYHCVSISFDILLLFSNFIRNIRVVNGTHRNFPTFIDGQFQTGNCGLFLRITTFKSSLRIPDAGRPWHIKLYQLYLSIILGFKTFLWLTLLWNKK